MPHLSTADLIGYTWATLGTVWMVGLGFTKRVIRRQAAGPRLFHLAVALTGFTLLGSKWFASGWLAGRLFPASPEIEAAGLAITIAGCAFAIWARVTLGGNWSGQATVKAGHELITSGPYALARHPIYTGLLTAAVGTGIGLGEVRCLLGFALIVLALTIKMSQEEQLMMQTFPESYPQYRGRVKAVIPGIL